MLNTSWLLCVARMMRCFYVLITADARGSSLDPQPLLIGVFVYCLVLRPQTKLSSRVGKGSAVYLAAILEVRAPEFITWALV